MTPRNWQQPPSRVTGLLFLEDRKIPISPGARPAEALQNPVVSLGWGRHEGVGRRTVLTRLCLSPTVGNGHPWMNRSGPRFWARRTCLQGQRILNLMRHRHKYTCACKQHTQHTQTHIYRQMRTYANIVTQYTHTHVQLDAHTVHYRMNTTGE